jgi:hypothetical protein
MPIPLSEKLTLFLQSLQETRFPMGMTIDGTEEVNIHEMLSEAAHIVAQSEPKVALPPIRKPGRPAKAPASSSPESASESGATAPA